VHVCIGTAKRKLTAVEGKLATAKQELATAKLEHDSTSIDSAQKQSDIALSKAVSLTNAVNKLETHMAVERMVIFFSARQSRLNL
jgi:hypothetical protein